MTEPQIRFDDGAMYEDFMGKWSGIAGDAFLDWLDPIRDLRWVDVGCGNGAFTEKLVARCGPRAVQGIDPAEAQLAFARDRLESDTVRFRQGEATALPFGDDAFDAAVMALVVFFVPDPARGVAEMARVVGPGGSVSAYAWDFHGGGFPFAALQAEMATLGTPPLWPPSVDASRLDALHALWADAGLEQVETHRLVVRRTFAGFDGFWEIARHGSPIAPRLATMRPDDVVLLQRRLRARLAADADGRIAIEAVANAVRGRVPTA